MDPVIIEDTRQKAGKHGAKQDWWRDSGVTVVRQSLKWGDYCLPPLVSVDTKSNLYELALNIFSDGRRFTKELSAARDAGVQLVVLTENDEGVASLEDLSRWRESPGHFYNRPRAKRLLDGQELARACTLLHIRYGASFEFCAPDEAAEKVVEILEEGGRR